DRLPGRDPQRPEHHGGGGGDLFAVAGPVAEQEDVHGVLARLQGRDVGGVVDVRGHPPLDGHDLVVGPGVGITGAADAGGDLLGQGGDPGIGLASLEVPRRLGGGEGGVWRQAVRRGNGRLPELFGGGGGVGRHHRVDGAGAHG